MIVYDKEQKEIVIPNGIGNINLFNNGVEVGYSQGKIDGINEQKAKLESINITENGTYSIDDQETVRSIAFDGYSYFNTGIFPTENIKIEACIKITNGNDSSLGGIIIGGGIGRLGKSTENRGIAIGMDGGGIYGIWGAIKSRNKSYKREGEGTTTVVLQKTDDSWVWDGEKGSFGASTLYIGGYNSNDIAVEKKFLQSIVYIKIWTDRNDDSTMTLFRPKNMSQGAFGVVNSEGIETGHIENLGEGTATFVKEKVKKYPYGFKRVEVNVPDLNGSYDEGYAQGKTDGINEQKSKLESINITENGTYRKEDGYNEVVVNVPDLNGSYDEGYEQGQADVAANARVLNVTENGNYLSKFSEPAIPTLVTGRYADGTEFYSYAELTNIVYNTGIKVSENTKIEIWYKPRDLGFVAYGGIIGPIEDTSDNAFNIHTYIGDGHNSPMGDVFNGRIKFYNSYYKPNDLNKWFHLELSFADGFVVDGVVVGTYTNNTSNYGRDIYINKYTETADGYYGMIKITTNGVENIIIPTAEGLKNITTNEMLQVAQNGAYTFTENVPIYGEGELYKTINVNVLPKINVKKEGLKLGYSTFTEVPEWVDFEGITDFSNVFRECGNLKTIPQIDTSNVVNMSNMFYNCRNLQAIPQIDTSNVSNMGNMFYSCRNLRTIPSLDTSKVTDMNNMFYSCGNLQTIPPLNTSKVGNMENMFAECYNLTSLPALNAQSLSMWSFVGIFGYNELSKLTDFGGFLNLKHSLTDDKNLKKLPNLTYESCINVLNGLYDFTGNGETPNSNQGQLKVAQSFIDKVGDKISIGVAKGWSISA